MTSGVKAGVLLAVLPVLTLACTTRRLSLELKGHDGHEGGFRGDGGRGDGPGRHACDPAADAGPGDENAPAAFAGNDTPGAPRLVARGSSALGAPARALAIADLDGDGRPDVVTTGVGTSGASTLSVLLNAGGGAFAPRADYSINGGATSLAIGDLNGDGRPDVVAGGEGGFGVEVLLNAGAGVLRGFALCACGGQSPAVALGDLDGDGRTDIVAGNRRETGQETSGDLVVVLNGGDDVFKNEPVHYGTGVDPRSVAVGDVNGDGRPDVVVGGVCGASVLLNAGDGTLAEPVRYETATGTVALQDLDGDGDLDIVNTGNFGWTVDVLVNAGGGAFGVAHANPVAHPMQTAVGDVNRDGRADLVVAEQSSDYGLAILLNEDGARFAHLFQYAPDTMGGYRALALADVDGDGSAEIVAAGDAGLSVFTIAAP